MTYPTHLADVIHTLPTTARELAWIFCDKKLGHGISRHVYSHGTDKKLVVKIEGGAESFQNIIEWKIWNAVKDTPHAKWFAPCVAISPSGLILIQKRAEKVPRSFYPKKIPNFLTDLKYENFGMIGKQFVCVDYGTLLEKNLEISKKLQKADWWDTE